MAGIWILFSVEYVIGVSNIDPIVQCMSLGLKEEF